MNPYFFSIVYRERLAQYEREAELRRQLPKRERRRPKWLNFVLQAGTPKPSGRIATPAEARPCH